jgi:predicted sugar kinase
MVLRALQNAGIAAGMSSLGPLIYAILDDQDIVAKVALEEIAETFRTTVDGPFAGWNSGAQAIASES